MGSVPQQESLLILVQDNDGQDVESVTEEELRRNEIAFGRVLSGQRTEFSCVLYIEGIVRGERQRVLQVLHGKFMVLDENFRDERTGESTENFLRRQQGATTQIRTRDRFSRMLSGNPPLFPFDPCGGDASFLNN